MSEASLDSIVGIYHAEGSLIGEIRYVLGKLRGTAHCALCDITHGRIKQKQAFKSCRQRFEVPFETLHLDEMTVEMQQFTAGRTPCVVGISGGEMKILLSAAELEACEQDVDAFEAALRQKL